MAQSGWRNQSLKRYSELKVIIWARVVQGVAMLHSRSHFLGGFLCEFLKFCIPSNLLYQRLAGGAGDQTLSLIATVEGLHLARHSWMILGLSDIFPLEKWGTLVMGSPLFQRLHHG